MTANRRLGTTGPAVFPMALGCMGMSGMYGPADENVSIAVAVRPECYLLPVR